jgi:hypothetical protein
MADHDVRVAAPVRQRIRPAFTVRKLEGKVQRKVLGFDTQGKKTEKLVEVDAGYMVTLAKGHSIRVYSDKDMHRLGFDRSIPLVDMENDGQVVGEIPNPVMA